MHRFILGIVTAVSLVAMANAKDTGNQDVGRVPVVSRDVNQHTHGNMTGRLESVGQAVGKLFMRADRRGDTRAKHPLQGARNPCLGKSLHIVDHRGC